MCDLLRQPCASPHARRALELGPMPVDAVNAVLGTELRHGSVRFSARGQRHAACDHPSIGTIAVSDLMITIFRPSYIGQVPHQAKNFLMVRRFNRVDVPVLAAALTLAPDEWGSYRVCSVSPMHVWKVDDLRLNGGLLPAAM